jgi:transposase-like protein
MPPVDRNAPIRAKSSASEISLMEFMRQFPDDRACLDWLWRERYAPDGHNAFCPSCDKQRRFHRVNGRPTYDCDSCGHHINPTAGTIFHKSSTSLQLWFYAMWIITSTRCGVSAKQLERELGVTYKTAWRMFNLIRNELMTQDDTPLGGEVEADETFIGGRLRASESRKLAREGKSRSGPHTRVRQTTFGMVERGGKVRAIHVPSRYGFTLRSNLGAHVIPASIVYTDDYSGYNGIERRYTHRRINHGARIYVDGSTHTQTIEGFFSLVKNGIRGVYHSVSAKWLQGYLNEYAWRYNHRDDRAAMFERLLARAATTLSA